MKIYIASRFGRKNDVAELQRRFKERGHEIIVDWTVHEDIKPYEQHTDLARQYAIDDAHGVMDCDAFILLTDEAGTGMHTEFGAALASKLLRGTPTIYVVGDFINNPFFFHPEITRCDTVEEVLRAL
ncbi:MAG TPA: hypothetical protein VMJ72_02105 [Candidatus Paceibacterota bacterium]|nr:hypothetical protein [Candidatus Paceibacterota bacterium]